MVILGQGSTTGNIAKLSLNFYFYFNGFNINFSGHPPNKQFISMQFTQSNLGSIMVMLLTGNILGTLILTKLYMLSDKNMFDK